MADNKISVTVDSKGRITIPKEVRERSQIDKGDTLFLGVFPGKIELTRAVEDPLVVLADWSRKEYQARRTQNLRELAQKEGIKIDE